MTQDAKPIANSQGQQEYTKALRCFETLAGLEEEIDKLTNHLENMGALSAVPKPEQSAEATAGAPTPYDVLIAFPEELSRLQTRVASIKDEARERMVDT